MGIVDKMIHKIDQIVDTCDMIYTIYYVRFYTKEYE